MLNREDGNSFWRRCGSLCGMHSALTVHAVIGGCITATQWAYWIICLIKKALSACWMVSCHLREKVLRRDFGRTHGRLKPQSRSTSSLCSCKKGRVCFTKKKGSDGDVQLEAPKYWWPRSRIDSIIHVSMMIESRVDVSKPTIHQV